MDRYTKETKKWLEQRFRQVGNREIYFAHQPIYGFRKGPTESGLIDKYVCTYQILKALSHLDFNSLLDVGGAEGYKAYVVNKILGAKVESSDLSEEACQKAREIFKIKSKPADIHNLPYKDNEFDVVLCSETLEHIADNKKGIKELLRVAERAVVITVPHESKKTIEKNIKEEVAHSHIHHFNLKSFDFLKESFGYCIFKEKMVSSILRIPMILADAKKRKYYPGARYPKVLIDVYNVLVPLLAKIFGERTVSLIIKLDEFICRFSPFYYYILFVILKDRKYYLKEEIKKISPSEILNISVPFYYLNKKDNELSPGLNYNTELERLERHCKMP